MTMMTHLLWAASLVVVVYGVTTSPLLSVPRMYLSLVHPLFEGFVYCAVCVGFWAAIVLELMLRPFDSFLEAAVFGAAGTHILTAALPRFLPSAHEIEGPIIDELREVRRKLKEN